MQESEPIVAITVRVSATTHQALQRLAQLEHRSLAGQAAHLLEQALAVEQRVSRALAAERAEHWARQARELTRRDPQEPRAGAEGGERDGSDPDGETAR
jgi:hypothetical protein